MFRVLGRNPFDSQLFKNSFLLGPVGLRLGLAPSFSVSVDFSVEIVFDKELSLCTSRDWSVQNVYKAAVNCL